MSKNSKEFNYCEFCDKAWEVVSPPSKEEYESGLINISTGSSILLPMAIAKDSHAKNLDGIYCNFECLVNQIKAILKINESE